DPEAMGIPRSMIVLGKHSGRHAIKHRVAEYGVRLAEVELEELYTRFKEKADEQKLITDDVLMQLVSESTSTFSEPYTLIDLQVLAGTSRSRMASVTVRCAEDGAEETFAGTGDGPLEAVIHCIQQAIPVGAAFEDLELHSLSTGEDAYGEAVVTVIHHGERFRGTAIHRDIILAAAKAYVSACNSVLLSGRSGTEEGKPAAGQ
ncbi:MAG: 2-isopropylmalate synthase, partial [Cohnella sp.]|nr:2-isopropylmalate synthase [Cohnella sp.]